MHRILVTGSRDWADQNVIEEALLAVWVEWGRPEDAVLIVGRCPTGADFMAENIWISMGLEVEPYPADWEKYGKFAGPLRNKQMVDSEPDICLAFRNNGSKGTANCMNHAKKAGIPVRLWEGP